MRHLNVAAIAAVTLFSATASPAWAGVECKADQVVGASVPGGTQQDAQNSWVDFVTAQFGADWANLGLATNQTNNPLNLNGIMWDLVGIANGGPAMFGAIPCRDVEVPQPPLPTPHPIGHVECKAQFIAGSGKDIRVARSAWTASVTRKYGAAWANADVSKYLVWRVTGGRGGHIFSLVAVPCRAVRGTRVEPKADAAPPQNRN